MSQSEDVLKKLMIMLAYQQEQEHHMNREQ